jgi:hypothetical protein
MKKTAVLVLLALTAAAYQYARHEPSFSDRAQHDRASTQVESPRPSPRNSGPDSGAGTLRTALAEHRSHVQVEAEGVVTRVLSDDNDGSRHQRFIVRVAGGHTVLIAHNIDLAPRVAGLREGDSIAFSGEYEWNDRGGVVHWTHRDPRGAHRQGWLEHDGRRYQ